MEGTRICPIVTGLAWMGAGSRSIDSTLREVVSQARRTLIVLAYAMSDGALEFVEMLRERLRAGVSITMVVNDISRQRGEIPLRLAQLVGEYQDRFALYEFCGPSHTELHAKAIIADEERAIIGSANLSWHGLVSNYELAVLVEGTDVQQLAATARRLINAPEVRRVGASA